MTKYYRALNSLYKYCSHCFCKSLMTLWVINNEKINTFTNLMVDLAVSFT